MHWLILLMLLWTTMAWAQAPTTALPTDPQQVQTLLQQSGCQYEITAAAQTIANLQKQINDLQKQLGQAKADPPKKK